MRIFKRDIIDEITRQEDSLRDKYIFLGREEYYKVLEQLNGSTRLNGKEIILVDKQFFILVAGR